ncbi:hypothetical protein GCM10009865_28150 [Aeromicrobium ponti]
MGAECATIRKSEPPVIITSEQAIPRSKPICLPSRMDSGERNPMQRTGIEVNKLAANAFMPRSLRMTSSMGAIELIVGLRFRDAIKRAAIGSQSAAFDGIP